MEITASRPIVVRVFLSPISSSPRLGVEQFRIQIHNLLNSQAFADFVGGVLQNDVPAFEWAEYFYQLSSGSPFGHVYPLGFSVAHANDESALGSGHDTAGRHEERRFRES